MKPRASKPCLAPFTLALSVGLLSVAARGADLVWDTVAGDGTTITNGIGTWQVGGANWNTAGTDGNWVNGNNAIFGSGTAGTAGTVILGGAVSANKVIFNAPSAGLYTIDLNGNTLTTANVQSSITVTGGTTATISDSGGGGSWNISNTAATFAAPELTGTLNVSAKVTGTGRMFTFGGGNLTLTNNANDFTGLIGKQNGGLLSVSSIANSGVASAAGAGNELALGTNAQFAYTGAAASTNRTLSLFGNNATFFQNGSGALVWAGAMSNTMNANQTFTLAGTNNGLNDLQGNLTNGNGVNLTNFTKSGAGTWQLSGNNSFTGTAVVNEGTLIANHANALGSVLGGTSVTANGQLILTGGIAVGAEALTLNSGAAATWNGQTGAALRNFSGNNSWAGAITLGQNTSIAANSGSALTVSGAISGGFNLTKADSGTLALSGANTYTGTTTISAGTLQVSGSSGSLGSGSYANTISIASGALLQYSSSINQTLSGAITGAGALTKDTSSTSTLTISSASTAYTGATTVNAGTLKLVNTTAFAGATTVGASGILELNSTNGTVDNWLSPDWTISGTGTINKTGTGWVDLRNANALTGFNGTLNIQQGTFGPGFGAGRIGSDTSTMTVNVSSGALFDIRATGLGAVVKIDKLTGSGTVGTTFSSGSSFTVGTGGGSSQFDGRIVGNGTSAINLSSNPNAAALKLIKAGSGKFTLTNTNTFTGGADINAGTLQFGKLVSQPASGAVAVGTGATLAVNLGGTGEWTTGTSGNGTIGGLLAGLGGQSGGTVTYTGNVALGFDTTNAAGTQTYSNAIGTVGTTLGITKLGTGTLTLSGVNTYTGATTIAAGTLQADRADVAAVSGALGNGGVISFTGGTLQYSANSAATDYSARILNSTTAAIKIDTNGQNVAFGTALSSSNTAGLTKEGAGQLELKMSNAAQYTGTTTINGGTLKFTQSVAEFDRISSPNININNGASLVIFSNVGGLNRTTINNGRTFTFGNTGGGSIVYDQGSHLWQTSTGKFVTTGGTQNTISGVNGGFINPQNAHTVNFEVADGTDAVDLLVSVAIGSGNYTKSGAGTLSITSFSTLGGGVSQPNLTINAGTFDVGGTARLTTVGQSTGVVTSDILNNGVYRHSSSNLLTLAGIMSGNGALTQNGSGTLTLSGANTFTGQTTISTGTLQIGAGSTTGKLSASSAIVNNSNLTINRSDAVTQGTDFSSAAITGTGSITAAGVGTTTLNAANSYSGATTVNAGADLRINGAQTGGGTVTVAATGKLGGSGSVIGGVNVSGVLAPGNSIESFGVGALSFSAGSTYAYELSTLGLNGDLAYSSGTLGIASGTILTLTDLGASTSVANGSKLTLISSVGAWNGGLFTYGGTSLADDSEITLGANIWRFNYNDTFAGSNFTADTTGATNYVTLTAVPEPNVAALLGGLATLLLLRRR